MLENEVEKHTARKTTFSKNNSKLEISTLSKHDKQTGTKCQRTPMNL